MDSKKVHIIFNPTAGGGKANKLQSKIMVGIEKHFGKNYTLSETHYPCEATTLSRDAIIKGANLIIAVGGDGTIQEVVNGFCHNGVIINPLCELGIIDCGTGSGLAQSLGLPESIDDQISLIRNGEWSEIDVGQISFDNHCNEREERIFVSECQVGIGSAVVEGVQSTHKRLGGKLAFGSVALKKLFRYEGQNISLQFDGDKKTDSKSIGVVIGNGICCGGGMRLTPAAQLNDGLLDVLTIHNMSTINRLINFPKIYWGKHVDSPYFDVRRSRKILIDSNKPLPIAADGEMLGRTPCEIEVLPAALKIKSGFKFKLSPNKKVQQREIFQNKGKIS